MEDFQGVLKVKTEAIKREDDFEESENSTKPDFDAVFGLDIEESKPGPFTLKKEYDDTHEEVLCRNTDLTMENEELKLEAIKTEEEFEEAEQLTSPDFEAVFGLDIQESKPDLDSLHCTDTEELVKTKSESDSAQEPQTCQLLVGARAQQGSNSNLKIINSQRLNIFQCDKGKTRHQCPHCDFASVRKNHLKRHIQARHTMERPHKCPHCGYACTQKNHLKTHIQNRHTMERPHQCPHCGYASTQKSHLKAHIQNRHTKEQPHQCPLCDFACASNSHLKQHILGSHSMEGCYQCPHCDFACIFVTRGNLMWHLNRTHGKELSYECFYCQFMCKGRRSIKIHIRKNHLDVIPARGS